MSESVGGPSYTMATPRPWGHVHPIWWHSTLPWPWYQLNLRPEGLWELQESSFQYLSITFPETQVPTHLEPRDGWFTSVWQTHPPDRDIACSYQLTTGTSVFCSTSFRGWSQAARFWCVPGAGFQDGFGSVEWVSHIILSPPAGAPVTLHQTRSSIPGWPFDTVPHVPSLRFQPGGLTFLPTPAAVPSPWVAKPGSRPHSIPRHISHGYGSGLAWYHHWIQHPAWPMPTIWRVTSDWDSFEESIIKKGLQPTEWLRAQVTKDGSTVQRREVQEAASE